MNIIYQLIRKSLGKYILAILLSTVAGIGGALMIKHIHSGMKNGVSENYLWEFVGYLVLSVVLGIIGHQMLTKLSEGNLKELRVSLSRKIMKSSYRKIEPEADKLIPILTTEIATIGTAAAKIPDVVTSVTIILGCLVYMFYLSWQYTLFAVGIFGVNFIMTVFVMPMTRKHEESSKELRFELFRHLKDMVAGLKELSFKRKLRRVYVNKLIEPTIEKQNEIKLKNNLIINSFAKIETVVVMGALALGVFYLQKLDESSSTSFVEFLALALFLVAPMTKINAFFRLMNRTTIAIESIENLGLSLKGYKKPKPKEIPMENWTKRDPILELRDSTMVYRAEDVHESFGLGPIGLKVFENETVFIVGGNGSGKTTLIKVLTGLYAMDTGLLKYKNCPITTAYLDDYQDKISALFSDDFVFRILYHIDTERLNEYGVKYLDYLELSNKVRIVNRRFSSVNLSYGQRKRLNLVMSLLEDKEIYVFDEWAANQDPHFKALFYTKILKDLKAAGKTIFVISHDDAYFDVADRIVKLQDGKIVSNEVRSKAS